MDFMLDFFVFIHMTGLWLCFKKQFLWSRLLAQVMCSPQMHEGEDFKEVHANIHRGVAWANLKFCSLSSTPAIQGCCKAVILDVCQLRTSLVSGAS